MERKSLIGNNGGDAHEMMNLPVGFRFIPTDEVLLSYYLKHKAMSLPMHANVILDFYVFKSNPLSFPGDMEDKKRYYFWKGEGGLESKAIHLTATRCGFWKTTGEVKQIVSSCGGGILGTRKLSIFYQKESAILGWSRTSWVMHELQLPNSSHGANDINQEWGVIKLFERKRWNQNKNMKTNYKSVRLGGYELLIYTEQKMKEKSVVNIGPSEPSDICYCSFDDTDNDNSSTSTYALE